MPYVTYRAKKFPRHLGPSLTGTNDLRLTWEDMVWAAITMGKPGFAVLFAHGWHSISDMVVRTHIVYANLRQAGGFVERSSLYDALDPTEKGATSYFMGMLAAKIMGARLLDVPWLFHLSMLESLGGWAKLIANSEPDLVGLTSKRDWVIAEAKGRTGGYSGSAMASAKLQTRQLRRINGQLPSLRVAVQAFFNAKMEWAIEDPDEFADEARDLDVDLESAFERYYSAVVVATEQSDVRAVANRKFRVRTFPEIGVTVGIDAEVRERVRGRTMSASEVKTGPHPFDKVTEEDEFVIFPDGLAISLDKSWAAHRMMQDPTVRRDG